MKIAHICHLSSSSGVSVLPSNLNKKLNDDRDFLSSFYHNDLNRKKKNFFFFENSKILSQSVFDLYLKYKSEDVANFCFFYEGIYKKDYLKLLNEYDVIHLHWINYFLNLENLDYISKFKPIVITVHDQHLLFGGCHWRNNCENYKINCEKCPQLHEKINNIANYNFLKKKEIFDKSNITFVHQNESSLEIGKNIYKNNTHTLIDCSIDTEKFNIIENKLQLKKKYNFENKRKIILSLCGYNSYTKGSWQFDELEKQIDPSILIILVGSGFDGVANKKNRVINFGHINDKKKINELYNISDICFSLSREEGVPGIACESLSAGIPFIGFKDVGNLNRMILNGKNGFLIEQFSIKEFAKKLEENFLPNISIRKDFLERFENKFYKSYRNIYQNLKSVEKNTKKIDLDSTIYKNFKQIVDRQIILNKKLEQNIISFSFYFIKNHKEGSKLIIRYLLNKFRRNGFILFLWRKIFSNKIRSIAKKYLKKTFN